MLKTFWTGIDGWADQQLADGTVVWTAPTGRAYETLPGSRIFFPTWNTTTAELPRPTTTPAHPAGRGLMMPKRRHTRAADRANRIREERALNAAHFAQVAKNAAANVEQRSKPPPTEHRKFWEVDTVADHDDDDPPPF